MKGELGGGVRRTALGVIYGVVMVGVQVSLKLRIGVVLGPSTQVATRSTKTKVPAGAKLLY